MVFLVKKFEEYLAKNFAFKAVNLLLESTPIPIGKNWPNFSYEPEGKINLFLNRILSVLVILFPDE